MVCNDLTPHLSWYFTVSAGFAWFTYDYIAPEDAEQMFESGEKKIIGRNRSGYVEPNPAKHANPARSSPMSRFVGVEEEDGVCKYIAPERTRRVTC